MSMSSSVQLSVWSGPAVIKVFVYNITVNKLLSIITSDQKFRFSLVTFFIFVYQTVNRGDHRKVPNDKNVNIWKNANYSHKSVKLLKLRTEKCFKDIYLLS